MLTVVTSVPEIPRRQRVPLKISEDEPRECRSAGRTGLGDLGLSLCGKIIGHIAGVAQPAIDLSAHRHLDKVVIHVTVNNGTLCLVNRSRMNTWTTPAVRAAPVPSAFRHAAPKVRFGSCHPELTARAVALSSIPDL